MLFSFQGDHFVFEIVELFRQKSRVVLSPVFVPVLRRLLVMVLTQFKIHETCSSLHDERHVFSLDQHISGDCPSRPETEQISQDGRRRGNSKVECSGEISSLPDRLTQATAFLVDQILHDYRIIRTPESANMSGLTGLTMNGSLDLHYL
jgi:hypothetical protein